MLLCWVTFISSDGLFQVITKGKHCSRDTNNPRLFSWHSTTIPTHGERERCSNSILPGHWFSGWFPTVLLSSFTMGSLGICTTVSYRPPCFTHIIAGAVEIVSTVHGDINGMHFSPAVSCAGFGEVTWRWRWHKEVTATQTEDFSFTCSSTLFEIGTAVRHTVTLWVTSYPGLLGHCKNYKISNRCVTLSH